MPNSCLILYIFDKIYFKQEHLRGRGCLSTLTLSILTLSKVSFSDILRNDYLDHFDTFENDTFEGVWVDAHSLGMFWKGHFIKYKLLFADF